MSQRSQAQAVWAHSEAVQQRHTQSYCGYPSRVTIDLDAVASNVRSIKSAVGDGVSLMAVVKANAYGHSACDVACAAIRNGADLLAVANLPEAIELRRAGIDAPILSAERCPGSRDKGRHQVEGQCLRLRL